MSDSPQAPVVKTYMSYVPQPGALDGNTVYETRDLDIFVNKWIIEMTTKHGGSVQVIPLPPEATIVPATGFVLFLHQTTLVWTPDE